MRRNKKIVCKFFLIVIGIVLLLRIIWGNASEEKQKNIRVKDIKDTKYIKDINENTYAYDDTDKNIEQKDGKQKEENIRVVIRTSDYQGIYHKEVRVKVNQNCKIVKNKKEVCYTTAKEEIIDVNDFKLAINDRIKISTSENVGIYLLDVKREEEMQAYRGNMEIERREEGYIIINELPLEEYLYGVIPSEMPASFSEEALRAQAICARTYARKAMQNKACAEYDADVDDSAAFQVYHNIAEQETTTKAVRDTQGIVLMENNVLADALYYSTSCGYNLNEDRTEGFSDYICHINQGDFECEEPWYRWYGEIDNIDYNALMSCIRECYQRIPEQILMKEKTNYFFHKKENRYICEEIKDIGILKKISILSREENGIVKELLLEGSKNTIKIIGEYNIRYILADGGIKIEKQDGTISDSMHLLPSAFILVEPTIDKNGVVGYAITGGGYGHGTGMSQNAANKMAEDGMNYKDILMYFYKNASIVNFEREP